MVYFVALPFVRVDGGLAPGEASNAPMVDFVEGEMIATESQMSTGR